MPIIAKGGNAPEREKCPEGQYGAVCIGVYDLGTQKINYKGVETEKEKVLIAFELDQRMKNSGEYTGKRFVLSTIYTNSLYEKANLRKDLEAWRGKKFTEQELKGFDLEKLIGVPCLIQVVHDRKGDETYVNINSIMGLPRGMERIQIETDWSDGSYPDWIKKKQRLGGITTPPLSSEQDSGHPSKNPFDAAPSDIEDDEIPF